jgi:hypothetical protein
MEGTNGIGGTKQEIMNSFKEDMPKNIFLRNLNPMDMKWKGMADGSIHLNINMYGSQQSSWGGHLSSMVTGRGGEEFIAGSLVNHGDGFLFIMEDGFIHTIMGGLGCPRFVMLRFGIQGQWHGTSVQLMFHGFRWLQVKFILDIVTMVLKA